MSAQVQVYKDTTWSLARRTTHRLFLFTPDHHAQRLEQAFWYLLGYYAQKHGLAVHAAVLMSNHLHYIVTDREGTRPFLKHDFHTFFARYVKVLRAWPEEVFNKSKTSEQEVLTPHALLDRLAYLIANPVDAFAVRHHWEWPGAKTRPEDIGTRVLRVPRPDAYLRDDDVVWPAVVEFPLEMPSMLEREFGAESARRLIAQRVAERERAAWQRAKAEGRSFLGVRRVRATRHTFRASSFEPFGGRNPTFAAGGDREAAARAVRRNRQFRRDYERALARWTSGERHRAVFPHGTWWMVIHHKARVRPPPTAS